VALAILSGLTADEFMACVASEDVSRLTHVPGIGRKTAERLIVEMRGEVLHPAGEAEAASAAPVNAPRDPVSEAVSALIALGYKPQEASRSVRGIDTAGLSSEDIIRHALKGMAGTS
jgi:Holliday junction DNA helicase RuvA